MCRRRFICIYIIAVLLVLPVVSQEALKSMEEEYYDFLSLQGLVERPTLNYRTLSDSEWNLSEALSSNSHIWRTNNLGTPFVLWQATNPADNWFTRGINQSITMKAYGPEWYNSFNTAAPYGQNDGALWQGRGYNTSLTGGIRFEAYGFEATFKPQLSFSQNMAFDYIPPNYAGIDKNGNLTIYADKASQYGYYGVSSVDAPQRFGDKAFFTFDWADSEIRWSWYSFTVGFGTQTIWLGPANLNPIIHSNNATSYPKLDIGMRRQSIILPWLNWYIGDFEFRGWWGKLSESDYFDTDDSNNNNLISGLAVAWSLPGVFKGLTVGMNRTMLSKWDAMNAYSLFEIFIPSLGVSGRNDVSDQRFSFTADYLLPTVGLDLYMEWARNDFSPGIDYIIRYPFHTQAWTFGAKKVFDLPHNLKLQILLEITHLECSADYDRLIRWYSTFYAHHLITQGYTNRGQWLGAGIGTGGNSQYIGFKLYYKWGSTDFFIQRRNPDLDYTMFIDSKENAENDGAAERNIRVAVDFGISTQFYITSDLRIRGTYVFVAEQNPLNVSNGNRGPVFRWNNHVELGLKYIL